MLGTESQATFYVLSPLIAGGIQHILCDPTGKGPLEAGAWFPLNFGPAPFLFAGSALQPLAVLNFNRVCGYLLHPVGSSSEPMSLQQSWGPLTIWIKKKPG